VPGTYTLELSVDGKIITQSAEIKADPKVLEAGITQKEMNAQVALSLQVVDLISEAKKITNDLDAKMKPLKAKLDKKANKKTQSKYDAYAIVYYQLVTSEGIYMRPMLNAQLGYLGSMINRADQQPGKDAYERYDELKGLLAKIKMEAGKLK
jgi:hypothetical protein